MSKPNCKELSKMPWAKPGYWSIYRITCLPIGKSYIGLTSENVKRRWLQHKTHSLNEKRSYALGNAIRKYGSESFSLEVLERCQTIDDAVAAERKLIAMFNTLSPAGYNLTDGGEHQKNLTAEARRKMSDAAKGRVVSPETRAKWSAQRKGVKRSPEVVERMRQARLLRGPDPARAARNKARAQALRADPAWIAARQAKEQMQEAAALARETARAERVEARAAWEAGRAGRKKVRDEKVATWHRGRKRSAETRKRISDKARGRIGAVRKKNASGVAGVWFDKNRQLWRAQMTVNGKVKALGRFANMDDAIAARRAYEALPGVQNMVQSLQGEQTTPRLRSATNWKLGVPRSKNKTGVAGVSFNKTRNAWEASISFKNKKKWLGRFKTSAEAVAARRDYERLPELQAEMHLIAARQGSER